jgi:hypothetical protein
MRRSVTLVSLIATMAPANLLVGAEAPTPEPVTIAVFPFELVDSTPAAAYLHEATSSDESLQRVTAAAREQLANSGHYRIVSVDGVTDSEPLKAHKLRDCDGCEADIAKKLGAQQSMIGVVSRATQTDYYIALVIRDVNTGKVVDAQASNFAGAQEGWPSGVKMLIKHQVLNQ